MILEKQRSKIFLAAAAGLIAAVMLAVALLNYLVDPLLHFHTPWFGLQPVLTNSRYQNAGCIRHLPYDNVILGNSMCENFQASWFDGAFGGKTAKLPLAGAVATNWEQEFALLRERHPKHVLMNLDYDLLSLTPDRANYTLPQYLYDNNPWNDVNYLLNLEVLASHTIPTLLCNLRGEVTDLDRVYEWAETSLCSREAALWSFHAMDLASEITYTPEQVIQQVRYNLGLLEPYFTSMPDTQFVFFVSPWSMLYWHMKTLCGEMEAVRAAYIEGLTILTSYENVTVFFWDDPQMRAITADLDNYYDISHYSKDISRLIARRIENREGIVTAENCREAADNFFDYLAEFPYETLFD